MKLRIFANLLLAFTTFAFGVFTASISQKQIEPQTTIPSNVEFQDLTQDEILADTKDASVSLCDKEDRRLLTLIVDTWVSGGDVENVAFCLQPSFVDLNEDGIDELAVRYFCSPTGNCSMKIYQRNGKAAREIFSDRQAVSYYDKLLGIHTGYHDLQTRSHDSCCDGDQVVYRYNGEKYEAISCSEYSYWYLMHTNQDEGPPILTRRSCRKSLDAGQP